MEIFRDGEYPRTPYGVTIGNFDGVHRGHVALIRRAQTLAKANGLPAMAMTFEPHPSVVLKGPQTGFLLTPTDLKLRYFAALGLDAVALLSFTPQFAAIPAETFLDQVLEDQFHARAVVVGYNFSFGALGRGTPELLRQWGQQHHIPVLVEGPFGAGPEGEPISSSRIRSLVARGSLGEAERLLGRPFTVRGTVVPGDQRGRTLGVPTLNLKPLASQVMPPYGVYAGVVQVAGREMMAVASFGVRPTFGTGEALLEIHALDVLDFSHYGQTIQFEWLHRLRGEVRFESIEALTRQMQIDIDEARQWLHGHPRLA